MTENTVTFGIKDADQLMIMKAQEAYFSGKIVTYTAKDGCKVMICPHGNVFFDPSDWW